MAMFFCLFLMAPTGWADTRDVALTGPMTPDELKGWVEAARDPDWRFTVQDIVAGRGPAFEPVTEHAVDFGYTRDAIWVKTGIRNDTFETSQWRVHIYENFLQVIEVYALREDGRLETLLTQVPTSPFSARPIQYAQLAAPLVLAPSERITLWIKYSSGGSSSMAFSLESDVSFSQKTAATTAKNALFYGMIILLIIFAIVGMVVLRQPMFLAYSAYSGSVLIYLMHSDGVAFQYLWPQFPVFNNNASVLIGASVCITAAICARVFVQTKHYHPIVDKILLGVIVFTFGLLAAAFFVDTQVIKKLLVLTSLIAIGMCLVAGLVASVHRFKQVRFFVIAWAGAVLSAGLMSLRHWFGIDISQEFQYDSMRLVMVFDASMMGMAIVDHYNQLRASRQTALRTSLSQVQRNLDLNKRLSHLEQTYTEMIERNASRKINFTNTMHDLRQPLHALRLNVSNLSEDSAVDSPDRQMVSDTFEYLERLISTQLSFPSAHPGEPRFVRDTPFPIPDTLERVHSMFLADAMSKGLTFRFHKNRHAIDVDPFVVLRILSNLVSNAIKYTDHGTIALGSRRVGDVLHIVVMDTGRGMSEVDFEKALGRAVRLETTAGTVEGNGYGLAIAKQLAHQNGWILSHRSRREGTAICLQIQMANTLDL